MLEFISRFCPFILVTICILSVSAFAAPPVQFTARIFSNETTEHETASVSPHFITIDRLESLLRRAGEIFRPIIVNRETNHEEIMPQIPLQQLQPPTIQPYNFYLPPFEHEGEHEKLDPKSRNMEKFTPPPPVGTNGGEKNYYASKPKKLPKKFNAGEKLVNLNWLNAFEREALADANGKIPKAVYLINDERNRINFDDSFFGVDMHIVPPADNDPHKEQKQTNGNEGYQDFIGQTEDGEDLVAAPAAHILQLSYGYRT